MNKKLRTKDDQIKFLRERVAKLVDDNDLFHKRIGVLAQFERLLTRIFRRFPGVLDYDSRQEYNRVVQLYNQYFVVKKPPLNSNNCFDYPNISVRGRPIGRTVVYKARVPTETIGQKVVVCLPNSGNVSDRENPVTSPEKPLQETQVLKSVTESYDYRTADTTRLKSIELQPNITKSGVSKENSLKINNLVVFGLNPQSLKNTAEDCLKGSNVTECENRASVSTSSSPIITIRSLCKFKPAVDSSSKQSDPKLNADTSCASNNTLVSDTSTEEYNEDSNVSESNVNENTQQNPETVVNCDQSLADKQTNEKNVSIEWKRPKKLRKPSYKGPNWDPILQQYKCQFCEKSYNRNHTLISHRKRKHFKPKFYCQVQNCNQGFFTRPALIRHEMAHKNQYPFVCNECDYKTFKSGNLSNHKLSRHTIGKTFHCDVHKCGLSFKTELSLKLHKRRHHSNEPTFKCQAIGCDQLFFKESQRFTHMVTVHNQCIECDWPGCNYKSNNNSKIKQHRRTHTGEKPFHCDWPGCDKQFARNEYLRSHSRVHLKPIK